MQIVLFQQDWMLQHDLRFVNITYDANNYKHCVHATSVGLCDWKSSYVIFLHIHTQ